MADRFVTIIGYGNRGRVWAHQAVQAGWYVRIFDPAATSGLDDERISQHELMSTAVDGADWIVLCLPDRLALLRKVIQHLQTTCGAQTAIGVMSVTSTVQDLQGCAKWPGAVVHVELPDHGTARLNVTPGNSDDVVAQTRLFIAALGLQVETNDTSQMAPAIGVINPVGQSARE